MGKTEVTRGQFRAFVEATGYRTEGERPGSGGCGWDDAKGSIDFGPQYVWRNPGFPQNDDHPVVNVTWNDAVKFCEWLSLREGREFRLPTQKEWEYACRAGTTTRYWTGDSPESLLGAANVADQSAKDRLKDSIKSYISNWKPLSGRDGYAFTAPVGRFRENPFGLHDMHGNVWEWCALSDETRPEPGFLKGPLCPYRGGCLIYPASFARSAYSPWTPASGSWGDMGFRVACPDRSAARVSAPPAATR
jgi:formylglycine-generating enzyme required for sulfatase activity